MGLPNKNYKGSEKLAPPAAIPEIPGFEPAQITPVKSFTSTFLKKAVSKSGTPKKINFALTQNKAQDFVDHLRQVKSSPQTPHDPDKKPVKKLLKRERAWRAAPKS